MISEKRKDFIKSLKDDSVRTAIKNKCYKNNRLYAKYSKKLRHMKKKSKKKNWSVKTHNLRVLYLFAYGKSFRRDNMKRVVTLNAVYRYNNKKITNMKALKMWLNSIDFDSNFMLLWHITKDNTFKAMLLNEEIRKKSVIFFSEVDKKEALLKDVTKMLTKQYV